MYVNDSKRGRNTFLDFDKYKLVMPWFPSLVVYEPQIILVCSDHDFTTYVYKLAEIATYVTFMMNDPPLNNGRIFRDYGLSQPMTIYNTMLMMGVLIVNFNCVP